MTDEQIEKLASAIGHEIMVHVDNPSLIEIERLLEEQNRKLDKLIELLSEEDGR